MRKEPYRRTHRKHIRHRLKYFVPPYPLAGFLSTIMDDDNIFMLMTPCPGKLKDITLDVEIVEANVDVCLIVYKEGDEIHSQTLPLVVGINEMDNLNIALERGEKAVLYLRGGKAEKVWFSCTFTPKITGVDVLKYVYKDPQNIELIGGSGE